MTTMQFQTLVASHIDYLKPYALHFTRMEDNADDLIQETLMKAINYQNKFQEGSNLKAWLYTIMKNTFINNYRKATKANKVVIQTDEIYAESMLHSSTKNQAENKFIRKDIENALNKLSDDYYKPFTMYFEGYKYHEIADYLSIPIGTVKTRIHIARKLLKKSLKQYKNI